MQVGEARYGFLLTQKGRVLGDVVVIFESVEQLKLASWSLSPDILTDRLESYIIADDVELADETPQWKGWQAAGSDVVFWLGQYRITSGAEFMGWAEANALPPGSLSPDILTDRLESYIIADDVELADETPQWKGWQAAGSDVVFWLGQYRITSGAEFMGWAEANALPPGSIRLLASTEPAWPDGWQSIGDLGFEVARVSAGIPQVPEDLGAGDFPQETGQEKVGVSFTKGCYLGQEVMARLATTGRVRRQLRQVQGTGCPPSESGSPLDQNGKKVGELRSTVETDAGRWIGLAMINLAHFGASDPVSLPGGAIVEVLESA